LPSYLPLIISLTFKNSKLIVSCYLLIVSLNVHLQIIAEICIVFHLNILRCPMLTIDVTLIPEIHLTVWLWDGLVYFSVCLLNLFAQDFFNWWLRWRLLNNLRLTFWWRCLNLILNDICWFNSKWNNTSTNLYCFCTIYI